MYHEFIEAFRTVTGAHFLGKKTEVSVQTEVLVVLTFFGIIIKNNHSCRSFLKDQTR